MRVKQTTVPSQTLTPKRAFCSPCGLYLWLVLALCLLAFWPSPSLFVVASEAGLLKCVVSDLFYVTSKQLARQDQSLQSNTISTAENEDLLSFPGQLVLAQSFVTMRQIFLSFLLEKSFCTGLSKDIFSTKLLSVLLLSCQIWCL